MKKFLLIPLVVVLVSGLVLGGCVTIRLLHHVIEKNGQIGD